MEIEKLMQELVKETPGALGSLLIGKEGVTIAEFHRLQPTDLDLLAAEYLRLCQDAARLTTQLNLGTLRETVLTTDRICLYGYFFDSFLLGLLTLTETPRGQALFHLRSYGHLLTPELS